MAIIELLREGRSLHIDTIVNTSQYDCIIKLLNN